jgi:protein TonB
MATPWPRRPPLAELTEIRELLWPMRWLKSLSTMQIALLISLGVHGAVLTIRFVDPEGFNRVFQDTALEVILVNTRSGERPDKAQALAQANLAGGGDADRGRATSPLPPSAQVELGEADDEQRRQLEQMQQQQVQLLARLRREMAMLLLPDPRREEQGTPGERDPDERVRQAVQQLAEIEKRINAQNQRPRKRFISPATSETVYALYYDGLRRKIEDRGTRNFPMHNGRKLYGELIMNIVIDARGQVVDTEIVRTSGSRVLDSRAAAIVRAAAPFGAFTSSMQREADQLVVTSRFRFTRDDGLETSVTER